MRALAEWILKPLVIAAFTVLLAGLVVGAVSQQYSYAAMREVIARKLSQDYERKLSQPLLAELRAGGFTLFIRHASRDGLDVPAATTLDRAYLIDPAFVPLDFRWSVCLNEFGRAESHVLGKFFNKAQIPVGQVLSSPLCRARETAQLSVGRIDRIERALVIPTSGLKQLLEQAPARGTNRLLFSHVGGVLETLGYERLGIEQAGMAVFQHTPEGLKIRAIVTLREMINALAETRPTQ